MNGYIPDVIEEDHWLGAVSNVIVPDRDWRLWLPKEKDLQRVNGLETQGCTVYNTHVPLQVLMTKQYGLVQNFSDRYLNNRAGTTPNGNSPHHVIEVLRKYVGAIPESTFGFTEDVDTWNEYYSGVMFGHKLLGIKWLMKWEVNHSWAVDGSETNWQDAMYDALQRSPLGAAVDAWNQDGDYYVRTGQDNHWTSIVYAKKNDYWLARDSYDPQLKKLEWNYEFERVKEYSVKQRIALDLEFYARVGQGLSGLY